MKLHFFARHLCKAHPAAIFRICLQILPADASQPLPFGKLRERLSKLFQRNRRHSPSNARETTGSPPPSLLRHEQMEISEHDSSTTVDPFPSFTSDSGSHPTMDIGQRIPKLPTLRVDVAKEVILYKDQLFQQQENIQKPCATLQMLSRNA
ncbi:hypothetical protein NW766_002155 [Fusarium irregulare]|uniref:Uncharacterized protein n=1 Tax=Fusarium irregulare TaxID=2494466 RepID=A0A9W8PX66_9HYPO|nr:hypothetical protein NW766_002155 [Fusarium irregulare]